ncbi:cytochrome c [Candidatus Venteria ishoeyi]|nr:cytochrome c [Candidatus Venteria ishoeyi]MDM8546521.1 cytochrome c [Candidatus Venteria ishoeyi]
MKFITITMALFFGSFIFMANSHAEPSMDNLKAILQKQMDMMKPELKKKVQGLSTDTKMAIMAILAMHNRYSDKATLRQVMLEVLQDYQGIVMGIMTNSSEMVADSARRLANHRIPVGGLLPYMGMENITDERLALLEGFNDTVEGNAIKLAKAADGDDMAQAAALLAPITSGCVACHDVFRGKQLGASDLLK